MKATQLDYELPAELIAQRPADRRGESRLLVWRRGGAGARYRVCRDLPEDVQPEARAQGSAAAPTAGPHFTPELLARVDVERVTLHVGLDAFRPLASETLEGHRRHGERYEVSEAAWARISAAARVLAIGTTTTRVL